MISAWDLRQFVPNDGVSAGSARVVFEAPDGEVSGPATIHITADGHVTFKIDVEHYSIPPDYRDYLPAFLSGHTLVRQENGSMRSIDSHNQKIPLLEAETSAGRFQGTRGVVVHKTLNLVPGGKAGVTVVVNDLEFIPTNRQPEEVWCLPLFGHLRSFVRAQTACSLDDKRPYIAFQDEGRSCGLEILDSNDPSETNRYSAVAFGAIGTKSHQTVADIRQLLPDGLLTALSFATGSDVRAPWLDLRSFHGQLSRRFHFRTGGSAGTEGYAAFTEFDTSALHSGIGAFLNLFFSLPSERLRQLIAPVNLIRAGTPGSATIDESIADLVKALDALCAIHGFETQDLIAELDQENARAVQQIFDRAGAEFDSLRQQSRTENKLDQLAVLDRIRSRQANVGSRDRHFGIALANLLEHFALYDATVMNSHYAQLPSPATWEGLLSAARGQVIHSGAIHIDTTGGIARWFELARHLHDLCKRLILREVGYRGTYAASNVPYIGAYDVDRINPSTTVRELGYTEPPVSL